MILVVIMLERTRIKCIFYVQCVQPIWIAPKKF
jgi:hypothetical protein